MPLSSIVAAVSKNSKSAAGTLAVVPLVLTSAGITSYARYAASHADSKTSSAELEREEQLHQHVALAWKGAR
jgi:hypothetical protein